MDANFLIKPAALPETLFDNPGLITPSPYKSQALIELKTSLSTTEILGFIFFFQRVSSLY